MNTRNRDAIAIQPGSCIHSGVDRELVRAIDEASQENPDTDAVSADPACRLICHQLAFLMGVGRIDDGTDDYSALIRACGGE